jgi:hypothetical protein
MPDNLGNLDSSDGIFMNDERTVGGNLVKSIDGIDNDCNDINRDNCINASSDIYANHDEVIKK